MKITGYINYCGCGYHPTVKYRMGMYHVECSYCDNKILFNPTLDLAISAWNIENLEDYNVSN